jgi:XTP/dITP diphosphohydrolase
LRFRELRRLVLASGNPGKLRELSDLLTPLGVDLAPQSDWQVPEAPEDAPTFLENALVKARNAARFTGLPVIADDSGLVVPALGGAPGIFSARYAGPAADDAANNRKLLAEMRDLHGPDRAAYFHCTVVLLRHPDDPVPRVASEDWWGEIATRPRGGGGFGYDPLFWLADRQCTSAELPPAVKNRISHRGRAMHRMLDLLRRGNGSVA